MDHVTPVDALRSAIDLAGGLSSLAEKLSARRDEQISPPRVWNWLNRDGGAPSEFCPDIEAITGVKCEFLHPTTDWSVVRKGRKPRATTETTAGA